MLRLIILILIIGLIISSCSNIDSENNITGKPIKPVTPVTVNWVGHWQKEGFKEKLLYQMTRKFEFENQDIVLNLKFPDDIYPDDMDNNKFVFEQIQKEKSEWDILRINNEVSGVANLMNDWEWPAKFLEDFSQYDEFRKNSIDWVSSPEMKKRWGGIVPGHALDAHNFVLWCNKEVAEKAGITIKQFGITTEDFENYLKQLHDYNRNTNSHIYGFAFNTGWLPAYALPLQLFASLVGDYNKLINEDYSEEKIQAWEQVLRYLEKISSYKPIDPQWWNIQYGTDYNKPLNNECLFVINGTWMYNIWQDLDSIKYAKMIPLELPAFRPSKTYIGEVSIPWVVPKNALHIEEAKRFILFWCQPEVADEWTKYTKSPSGIKGSLVQSEFGFDDYETFDYTIAKKYNGSKIPLNYGNNTILFGKNNILIPNYFIDVLTGGMTADEAIKKIKTHLVKR